MGPSLGVRNCDRTFVFFRFARRRASTSPVVTIAHAPANGRVA